MQKERTKMCPSCDGCVPLHEKICPYCASNVLEEDQNQKDSSQSIDNKAKPLSYEESLSSLYPPPYKPKVIHTSSNILNDQIEDEDVKEEESEENTLEENKALIPTVLFWLGVNMCFFSILLVSFSKDGFLHLKFNSKYWFAYSILSLPFLFFGFKGLKKID